jgi:leucyl aminopeptidase
MKNAGGRFGGSITAALFLEKFINEGVEWAHLDIAGRTGLLCPGFDEEGSGQAVMLDLQSCGS